MPTGSVDGILYNKKIQVHEAPVFFSLFFYKNLDDFADVHIVEILCLIVRFYDALVHKALFNKRCLIYLAADES